MSRLALALLALGVSAPLLAASALDTLPLPDDFFADRARVHAIVTALEEQPLHANADLARAILLAHYEKDVDYIICGDVLGPLTAREDLGPVLGQVVIASGDWVEGHPDNAKDIDAYTLAGLEGGVRAYRHLREAKPSIAPFELMETLATQYDAGTLPAWNLAHPCRAE
jgi:hypothetical protein